MDLHAPSLVTRNKSLRGINTDYAVAAEGIVSVKYDGGNTDDLPEMK